jgi:hypothetical protein
MRRWIARHVLQSLVERIDRVDLGLKNLGWDHLSTMNASFVTGFITFLI